MILNKSSIMFVSGPIDVGGAGKMLKYVANNCCQEFDAIYVTSLDDVHRSKGLNERIIFEGLGGRKRCIPILWRLLNIRDLRKVILAKRPDILCCFTSEVAVMAKISVVGIKNVTFCSAERGDPYTLPFVWQLLVKQTYKSSDFCFFQLEKARDFFGPVTVAHSFVIPNAFEKCDNQELPIENRDEIIVSAGRFVKEKQYDILIRAFKIVHDSCPNFQLVLYGEGPLLESYKQLAAELNLQGSILFPGYLTHYTEHARKASVFVLSSKFEGIPNSMIEAMAAGIPCVSTDCTPGGPDFLTNHGERGILVPVGDETAMAEAILMIINNPEISKKFSMLGPEIAKELDPQIINQKWVDAFNVVKNRHNNASN